jgi:hypothetical protein
MAPIVLFIAMDVSSGERQRRPLASERAPPKDGDPRNQPKEIPVLREAYHSAGAEASIFRARHFLEAFASHAARSSSSCPCRTGFATVPVQL